MMGKYGTGELGAYLEWKEGKPPAWIAMRFTIRSNDPNQIGTRLKIYLRTKDPAEARIRRDIVLAAFHQAGQLATGRVDVGAFVDIDAAEGGGRWEDSDPATDSTNLASMSTPSKEAPPAAGDPVKAEAPPLSIEARLAKLEALHRAEVLRLNGQIGRLEIQIFKLRQAR